MKNNTEFAIECSDLKRVYVSQGLMGRKRETVALDGITFQVPKGVVFGLLGPNGAGKTTTIRILSTLLIPTSGTARVVGFDVVREAAQVRRHIGLILGGDRGFYGRLSGRDNLLYFAALHHMNPREAANRAARLLKQVGLAEAGDRLVEQYSRGMRQRLHIARGLLPDPEILFMDEPTLGLDPIGAQEIKQLIPELVKQGKTILLTTHYMFEADQLCSSIVLINRGKLVAQGSPTEIRLKFSKIIIVDITLRQVRTGLTDELSRLEGVEQVDVGVDGAFQKLSIHVKEGLDLTAALTGKVGADSIEGIVVRDPTLEEAYRSILK